MPVGLDLPVCLDMKYPWDRLPAVSCDLHTTMAYNVKPYIECYSRCSGMSNNIIKKLFDVKLFNASCTSFAAYKTLA